VEEIRDRLPELPAARRHRFVAEYGLSAYDAGVLTDDKAVADYFEACVKAYPQAKTVSNWITGELFRLLKETETGIEEVRITPPALAELLTLVEKGTINQNTAKAVLGEMLQSGRAAAEIVAEKGLAQISDADELGRVIDEIVAANPDPVAEYRAGKERLLGWFVGQAMKATRGKANPQLVSELLKKKLR
jgi:aspartyl-tRNA(Asn)/glutamyl-tRNA(Gln) amidotransferase subunit B